MGWWRDEWRALSPPGVPELHVPDVEVAEAPIQLHITSRHRFLMHTGNTELDPVTGREIPKQSEQ